MEFDKKSRKLTGRYGKEFALLFWLVVFGASKVVALEVLPQNPLASVELDPEKVKMKAHIGFARSGGQVMLDSWIPVHAIITNENKSPLKGRLVCRIKDRRAQNTYNALYETEMHLPGNSSTKHFVKHVYLPQSLSGWNLEVVVESEIRVVMARIAVPVAGIVRNPDYGYNQTSIPNNLFLLLAKNTRYAIPPFRMNGRSGKKEVRRHITIGDKLSLPCCWIGYTGIEAIIWNGLDLSRLDHLPVQAMREYVQAGGHLVIFTGDNAAKAGESFPADMLPCSIGRVAEADISSEIVGRKFANAPICELIPKAGSWVLKKPYSEWQKAEGNGANASAVRKYYGAGAVTVAAFSISEKAFRSLNLSDRESAKEMKRYRKRWGAWVDRVLHLPVNVVAARSKQALRQTAYSYLMSAGSRKIPSRFRVISFLAVYILVIGPLTYMLFRGYRRVEFAWFFVPVIAVLFAAASYVFAFRGANDTLSFNDVSVAKVGARGTGGMVNFSLLHNPSYKRYDLSHPVEGCCDLYLAADNLPGSREDRDYDFNIRENGANSRLCGLAIPINGKMPLESVSPVRFGKGIHVSLLPEFAQKMSAPDNSVIGTVNNRTGVYLRNPVLLAGSAVCVLDSIAPEENQKLFLVKMEDNSDGKRWWIWRIVRG